MLKNIRWAARLASAATVLGLLYGCAAPTPAPSVPAPAQPTQALPTQIIPTQSAPAQASPTTAPPTGPEPTDAPTQAAPPTAAPATFTSVQIYLIALEDSGASGEAVGCGDSVVPVDIQVSPTPAPLRAALETLLAIKTQYYGESGLYNALYQSNLSIDSLSIDENGKATVRLTGQTALGGECDDPRFKAQLEKTVGQFSTVKSAEIFINDVPLDQAISNK
jgi:hypothetical protein